MLIAKLENMGYWGGKKNFMSVHKIAKGNGLDESYKTVAQEVAEYLSSDSRTTKLLSKKLGDGNVKYACNGELPDVVYGFLRDRRVSDRQVMHWLHGDLTPVSARELDHITPERYERKR
jgi:hypothetical protein